MGRQAAREATHLSHMWSTDQDGATCVAARGDQLIRTGRTSGNANGTAMGNGKRKSAKASPVTFATGVLPNREP